MAASGLVLPTWLAQQASAAPKAAAAAGMAVASAKVEITPPIGSPLAGYGVGDYGPGAGPRVADGVNAPTYARCTVFWDNGSPNVIVTAEIVSFPREVHQAIRARVTALGVANSDFVLTATHTHNGPVILGDYTAYTMYTIAADDPLIDTINTNSGNLQDAIVQLVSTTLAATPTPCTLDYRVALEDFSANREGLANSETDVPVLVARDAGGKPLVVLFGYGCHPVSAGSQTQIDPDYPGVACATIENATGAFAHFVTGPAGDQNPIGDQNPNSVPFNWGYMNQVGTDLGQTVVDAVARPGRAISGPILTQYQELDLLFDITDTPDNLAVARANFTERMNNSSMSGWGWARRHAEVMIQQIDAHDFAYGTPLPMQLWNFSGGTPLYLVMTGGEPISEYAVNFRNQYGGTNGIWFNGYANEVPAYIPNDDLLTNGGSFYACGWFQDYPGMGGGAMSAYGWIAHYLRNNQGNGVDDTFTSAVNSML